MASAGFGLDQPSAAAPENDLDSFDYGEVDIPEYVEISAPRRNVACDTRCEACFRNAALRPCRPDKKG
jgi:hypothetical protein